MTAAATSPGFSSYQTPLFTSLAQSIDNQYLPSITVVSSVLGVIAPYFKYLQDVNLVSTVPSSLLNRSPYLIVAGVSLTIMVVSRLPRFHNIMSIHEGQENQKTLRIMKILGNPESSQETKKELAEQIEANPGNYCPFLLASASTFFIKEKEFERAAILCVGGVCRSEIDVKISCDPTTVSVPGVAMMEISQTVQEHLTDNEIVTWNAARKVAYKNFIQWDQKTPRNYSDTWVRLNGMGALTFLEITNREKKRLIDCYYQEHLEAVSKLD